MTAWKVLILFKENVCSSSKTSGRKIFNVRHVTELICPKFCPDLDRRKVNFGCHRHHRIATRNFILVNLTLGRTRKFIPPPWYKGGGGVVDETPPQSYVEICCSISKRFYLQRKAFDLLNKMRYILWMVAQLEDCDVTHNGRHLGCHLGFY